MSLFKILGTKPWQQSGQIDNLQGGDVLTVPSARIGLWVFLAVVASLFGLFTSAYHMRAEYADWQQLDVPSLLWLNTGVLVFASLGDTWGLVVNEALACGVPALCSIHAGCADDLIRPGVNGWTVDPVDGRALTRALERALSHPDPSRLGAGPRAVPCAPGCTSSPRPTGTRTAISSASKPA